MTRRQLTLAVPALLSLHNLEEALTFHRYLADVQARVPSGLQPWVNGISPAQLYIALVIATVVPWAVALYSIRWPSSVRALRLVLLIQAVVFVNVFWHVLVAALLLQGYSPGLLTSVTLN